MKNKIKKIAPFMEVIALVIFSILLLQLKDVIAYNDVSISNNSLNYEGTSDGKLALYICKNTSEFMNVSISTGGKIGADDGAIFTRAAVCLYHVQNNVSIGNKTVDLDVKMGYIDGKTKISGKEAGDNAFSINMMTYLLWNRLNVTDDGSFNDGSNTLSEYTGNNLNSKGAIQAYWTDAFLDVMKDYNEYFSNTFQTTSENTTDIFNDSKTNKERSAWKGFVYSDYSTWDDYWDSNKSNYNGYSIRDVDTGTYGDAREYTHEAYVYAKGVANHKALNISEESCSIDTTTSDSYIYIGPVTVTYDSLTKSVTCILTDEDGTRVTIAGYTEEKDDEFEYKSLQNGKSVYIAVKNTDANIKSLSSGGKVSVTGNFTTYWARVLYVSAKGNAGQNEMIYGAEKTVNEEEDSCSFKPSTGTLTIYKVDADSKKKISGAKVTVFDNTARMTVINTDGDISVQKLVEFEVGSSRFNN